MKKLFVLVCLLAIGFCNVAWAAKRQAKHVVLIALDGWGAYSGELRLAEGVRRLSETEHKVRHRRPPCRWAGRRKRREKVR